MKTLKNLDPRSWFPGPELAEGMLEFGLEEFLSCEEIEETNGSSCRNYKSSGKNYSEE